MIRHGQGRDAAVRVLAAQGDMFPLAHHDEAEGLQGAQHAGLGRIHGKLRHASTVASATNASMTDSSASSNSEPKVSKWNLSADCTSRRAS